MGIKLIDKAQVKAYMKQFFGSKRYLYQNGRKVAHIHIVNGIYHFHGHFKTKFSRLKLEFKCKQDFNDYLEKHELRFKE
ncbi:SAV1978 family virulence-associated passenger protein [Staphylococcus pseudintermedius]|nr:SAV1978 family virulence-associated passenger protein [Staphylococcus pseudintermedius]EKH7708611.1 hypothetical protein [Staphylococcus pseudintermedius]EKI4599932.1 hypothetical protein [Staphylococcus pseudintermedius]MDQ7195463.1 SAV1978 family virulence-associated passenger protein [Staphylococcus pseudintermedius]MDT0794154.1 SAV1978 family virulence-associated passenger protein [Staphylococcus pseudintermedius]MDT0841624.1 SAV1978 family virulence-associated passenger protein [Staphy